MPPPRELSPLWPGIFDGDCALCGCTWGWLDGIRQVKVLYGACLVRHTFGSPRPAAAQSGQSARLLNRDHRK